MIDYYKKYLKYKLKYTNLLKQLGKGNSKDKAKVKAKSKPIEEQNMTDECVIGFNSKGENICVANIKLITKYNIHDIHDTLSLKNNNCEKNFMITENKCVKSDNI